MDVSFELKDMSRSFYIRAYIMDIEHGDKRTFNSEKYLLTVKITDRYFYLLE